MKAIIWHALMLVWLAALIFGLWWLWPNYERRELTSDLVAGTVWLILGALTWVLAFNYGRQHYWRR